jgi:hypothetical protein
MTEIIQTVLIFVGLSFLGYGLLHPFRSADFQRGERLLLGLALALGLLPLILFCGLLAGGSLGLLPAWLVGAGACLGLGLWGLDVYRSGWKRPAWLPLRPITYQTTVTAVLVAVIVALVIEKLVFATIQGFAFPTYFWDAVTNWNFRAKVLHALGRLDLDPQSDTFLGGGGTHYPIGPSLFRAWVSTLVGKWSEPAVAGHSIATYILLFGVIWTRLSKQIGGSLGMVFAYLAISIPLMVYHAYAGYADLLVAFFFSACLIYGYEYLLTRNALSGIVSALFLASALFSKNEGVVLVLPVMIVTVVAALWSGRVALRSAAIYFGIAVGLVLPWIALKAYFGLPYAPTETNAGFALHLLEGLPQLFDVVFLQGSFNLFGLFFVATVLVFSSLWWRTDVGLLALPVFLFFGAVLAVFLFTDNYEFLENQMTINRTLMIAMPSYIYLVGVSFGRKWPGEPPVETSGSGGSTSPPVTSSPPD